MSAVRANANSAATTIAMTTGLIPYRSASPVGVSP